MVDIVTIRPDDTNKSLEQEAADKGIDISKIDTTATSQMADPTPPKGAEEKETGTEDDDIVLDSDRAAVDQSEDDKTVTEMEGDDGQEKQSDEDKAREAAEKAGLDLADVTQRFYDNGNKLEDSDYEALDKAGYPKDMVDQFIEGRQAVVELQRQTVFAKVGGEEAYTEMTKWAAGVLSDDEIEAYNRATGSKDMTEVMMAVEGLSARYNANRNIEPRVKVGGNTRPTVTVYTNVADLKKDMSNPRYQTDPAYRAKVEQKLARSNIL